VAVYGCLRTLTAAAVAVTVAVRDTGRPSALQAGSQARAITPWRIPCLIHLRCLFVPKPTREVAYYYACASPEPRQRVRGLVMTQSSSEVAVCWTPGLGTYQKLCLAPP
jgi:hypothetical protein